MKNKIDKSNMHKIIMESADQLGKGLELAKNIKVEGVFKNIIICGIGGSALPANILTSVNSVDIPIYIHRDYELPKKTDENSLIICISYSGNTEEIISALNQAVNKKLKIVSITAGGKIEELCQKNSIPFVKIPSGIQPRMATGYIFSALVKILENSGIIKNMSPEILETAKELKKINLSLEKEGKKLEKKLIKKIPIIYASNNFRVIARIWKIKFNENAKIPAFYNYFPELNHNEMIGFSNIKNNFFIIIIQDSTDHPRTLKRMKLTGELLSKKGIKVEFINIRDGSILFKIFSTLLLGDWVSYYLTLEYKIDPTPVKIVEEFKGLMQK